MAHSAFFHRTSLRLSKALLIGIGVSAFALGGCDSKTNSVNKQVTEKLDDASHKLDDAVQKLDDATAKMVLADGKEMAGKLDSSGAAKDLRSKAQSEITAAQSERSAAASELESAVKEADASASEHLRATVMLADYEQKLAQEQSVKILANDAQIDRLIGEMDQLADVMSSNNQQVAGLKLADPTRKVSPKDNPTDSIQDAIKSAQDDVTGSDDKPDWYKSPDGGLPSLSANDKQIAKLNAEISTLQERIQSNSTQRNEDLDKADKLAQQSQHSKDPAAAMDLYTQGSMARKQAGDLSVKIDEDTAALQWAKANLTVRQGQHETLTSAIKALDDKSSAFSLDWKKVQGEIAAVNKKTVDLVGMDKSLDQDAATTEVKTEATVEAKAAAIAALAEANGSVNSPAQQPTYFGQAEQSFNEAMDHYSKAIVLANNIKRDLSNKSIDQTKPDSAALAADMNAQDPMTYQFLAANARLQKAEFLSRSAAIAKARLDLIARMEPLFKSADIEMPADLTDASGKLNEQLKKDQDAARKLFTDSSKEFTDIYEGGSADQPAVRTAAKLHEIYAQYGWSALETSAGDAQAAANHITLARSALKTAKEDGISLTTLPPEITEGMAAAPMPAKAR